jgi:hypothetical protein
MNELVTLVRLALIRLRFRRGASPNVAESPSGEALACHPASVQYRV